MQCMRNFFEHRNLLHTYVVTPHHGERGRFMVARKQKGYCSPADCLSSFGRYRWASRYSSRSSRLTFMLCPSLTEGISPLFILLRPSSCPSLTLGRPRQERAGLNPCGSLDAQMLL